VTVGLLEHHRRVGLPSTAPGAPAQPRAMPSAEARRLRAVLAGVVAPQAAGAAAVEETTRGTATAPTPPPPAAEPPLLLTEEQLKGWVARGYIALPVDTLPKEFHDQFHAATEHQKRSSAPARGNGELARAVDAVLSSPITRGALTSVLGPGYVGNVPGAGGSAGSNDQDQGYHSTSRARARSAGALLALSPWRRSSSPST
jgi:hypothetical protein